MADPKLKLQEVDPVWTQLREEASEMAMREPLLAGMVHSSVLHHNSFAAALSYRIAMKLASNEMPAQLLREIASQAINQPSIAAAARADLVAVMERDPACHNLIQPILYFKGYQAVQAYRVAHWLWQEGRKEMAYYFQMRSSEMFGVDIHPGAKIGQGIMLSLIHI